ncbi:NAD(P)-dependent alcohol dehydrogenase [Pseudomonas syringae]|nr:NAD(P)-dependent alcohol dehydrogenase [Pseudomonas syringae]
MPTYRLGKIPGIEHIVSANESVQSAPLPGEITVRVLATSLNQHDYNVVMGRLPSAPGRVLLSDACCLVETVGDGVTQFQEGDRVISCFFPSWDSGRQKVPGFSTVPGDGVDGFARSFVTKPASHFVHAPNNLDAFGCATLTTAALTAWRALVVENQVKPGDSVLTLGTGGVSIFAVQFSRMLGATVIGTSSADSKLEKLRALGVGECVNYSQDENWGQRVRALSGGVGADHVVEVGGQGTLAQSIEASRVGGSIALIGVLTGIGGYVPLAAMMGKQIRLQGITVASRQDLENMIRAIETNQLQPVIDTVFPLSDLQGAFRHMESGQHFGKIVIDHTK